MITLIKTLLRGLGINRFIEADCAKEALDLVQTEQIDFMIVDYLMDKMDGIEFVQKIRSDDTSPNPFVPVIMLTAYSERSRVVAARDAGVTEFCCKPINAQELYRRVVSIVNSPRPFVRTSNYFGPDRRRFESDHYRGPERREENLSDDEAA